jgi:hypothetical protein
MLEQCGEAFVVPSGSSILTRGSASPAVSRSHTARNWSIEAQIRALMIEPYLSSRIP